MKGVLRDPRPGTFEGKGWIFTFGLAKCPFKINMELVEYDVDERNKAIRELEGEISMLSEIMTTLSSMVHAQGEQLQQAELHVHEALGNTEDALVSLEQTDNWQARVRGSVLDLATFAAGTSLGALGFFAGPWVGLPTLISGVATATSAIAIRRKMQR